MIGLGIGLTPSADDYLTGLALILFIPGHPSEKYKEEFYPDESPNDFGKNH